MKELRASRRTSLDLTSTEPDDEMVSGTPPTIVLLLLTNRTNFDVLVEELMRNDTLRPLISTQPLSDSDVEEYMDAHIQTRHAAAAAAAALESARPPKRKRRSVMTSHSTDPEDDETYLVYPEEEEVRIPDHCLSIYLSVCLSAAVFSFNQSLSFLPFFASHPNHLLQYILNYIDHDNTILRTGLRPDYHLQG